jgi:hypothetical protein
MDRTKGCKQEEKEDGTFVLPAITTMCTYNVGVLQSQEFCTIFFNLFIVDLCYSVNISHPGTASHIYHVI